MRKMFFKLAIVLAVLCIVGFAQTEVAAETSKGIDWPQLLMTIGYLGGVFVLLPLVIYTNMKEKIEINPMVDSSLTEEERNSRASIILGKIESMLTPFKTDDGEEMITITKGKQAKFMKNGLEYILNSLLPTDEALVERTEEFKGVYEDRTQRAFTGSKWIILCGIALGVLIFMSAGFSTFIIIHALGLVFYVLSSRTTMYGIERRMELFGGKGGTIGRVMSALFLGEGTKHYVKQGSGPWKRDWETEGQMAMIGVLFLAIIALFLGFFAAFLGVINFVINYSTFFIIPFKSNNDWYKNSIAEA